MAFIFFSELHIDKIKKMYYNINIDFIKKGTADMIVKEYIKNFEKLGFGMFVHFGIYSTIGRGEWSRGVCGYSDEKYAKIAKSFNPKKDWADELVMHAKYAGAKYITLTTRHHDGFSLYDTCGITEYDAPHYCNRDLIKEFTDSCRKEGIIPFFYHTLLDWHEGMYEADFPKYLEYLRKSVEVLCKNYGKIGGIWFDGMWHKPKNNWEEDALYSMIRKYQPEAMIINNTGLSARGALGHIELDSVTFERGRPQPINLEDSPKYIASEMCQTMANHWGCAKEDLSYKAPADIIKDLTVCRRYGSNFLLNVGPLGDGSLRNIEKATLEIVGEWMRFNGEAVSALPCGIEVQGKENDFILEKDGAYYLFCNGLPIMADPNVVLQSEKSDYDTVFETDKKIKSACWLDNGEALNFTQNENSVTVRTVPFAYGRDLVVRVAKITFE